MALNHHIWSLWTWVVLLVDIPLIASSEDWGIIFLFSYLKNCRSFLSRGHETGSNLPRRVFSHFTEIIFFCLRRFRSIQSDASVRSNRSRRKSFFSAKCYKKVLK